MKLFMVLFDWSTTDNEDIEIEVFDSFEKAYKRFNDIIENEKNPDISWVGSEAFDKEGNITDGFEFDSYIDDSGESDLYWNVKDNFDYYRHDFLDLKQIEVK